LLCFYIVSEEQKRNYFLSVITTHLEHKFNADGECDCGVLKHDGLLYERTPDEIFDKVAEKIDRLEQPKKKPEQYSNPHTEYLQRIKHNCHSLGAFCDKLVHKYYSNEQDAKLIEQHLKPDLEEQKSIEAQIIHMEKQIDYRAKVGEFEKLKARILEKCLFNASHVAKLLGITPKHMTNDIMKTEHPQSGKKNVILDNLKWFKTVYFKIPKDMVKGETLEWDASHWYNEQIHRKDLELELRNP